MKERIIVVPSSNSLALTLASHGKSLFNTRIFTPVELANEILMRLAIDIDKSFISRNEELGYYVKAIKDNTYFKSQKLLDINKVKQAITIARELIVYDEENTLRNNLSLGIFKEKNRALFDVYKNYIDLVNLDKKIDSIGLIRYVLDKADKIDSEIIVIKELKLNPLAKELVNKISLNTKEISISELFETDNKDIKINSYKNCYGSSNEVASVIADIYKNKKIDKCLVSLADSNTYSQIFFDYLCKYDIPVTFGCGIPIMNSYPGKLLEQYKAWSTVGDFGSDPFYRLILSPYFDLKKLSELIKYENAKEFNVSKFFDTLANLRLTNNVDINSQRIDDFKKAISRDINDNDKLVKYVDSIETISNELALPIEEFIDKYSVIRENKELLNILDLSARSSIINDILVVKNAGLDIGNDVIENVFFYISSIYNLYTLIKKYLSKITIKNNTFYCCLILCLLTIFR